MRVTYVGLTNTSRCTYGTFRLQQASKEPQDAHALPLKRNTRAQRGQPEQETPEATQDNACVRGFIKRVSQVNELKSLKIVPTFL